MYLKKAHLLRLPTGSLALIPLEKVKNGYVFDFNDRDKDCEIIKEKAKLHFWVYRKNAGHDVLGNENHIANQITNEDFEKISANSSNCLVEVDYSGHLSSPSNANGHRAILIHLDFPEYVCQTKNMESGFVFSETEETCPFCDKEKVVSGIYLHFQNTGHPCCNTCFNKKGFNEWFNNCQNMSVKIPKQIDWFLEMFCKEYTPEQAIDAMEMVV